MTNTIEIDLAEYTELIIQSERTKALRRLIDELVEENKDLHDKIEFVPLRDIGVIMGWRC